MAGDWIKMRIDLQSHPKVVRILSATRTDKFRVIGGLHAAWSVFDTHSEDGELRGYTPEALDHIIGWDGFARAMESVGWLLFDGLETLTLPEFTEHNGQSAKRRAEDQKRKKNTRNSVRILSADDEDKKQTREEKRREENIKAPVVPTGDEAAILSAYHSILPNCKGVEVLNPKRKKRIAAAVKLAKQTCATQGWPYDANGFWRAYFSECAKDPWMRGDVPYKDNPNWKQVLDTLISEDRFAGVMDSAIASMRSRT
jgi:hypothetical protein